MGAEAPVDHLVRPEVIPFLELHGYLNYTVICVPLAFGVFCWALAFSQVTAYRCSYLRLQQQLAL